MLKAVHRHTHCDPRPAESYSRPREPVCCCPCGTGATMFPNAIPPPRCAGRPCGPLFPRRRLCRWVRQGILPPGGDNNRGFPAGSAVRFPVLTHGEAGVLPASRSGKYTFINAIKSHISSVFKQYITHD